MNCFLRWSGLQVHLLRAIDQLAMLAVSAALVVSEGRWAWARQAASWVQLLIMYKHFIKQFFNQFCCNQ